MTAEQRGKIIDMFYEGVKYKDIAQEVNLPLGAVVGFIYRRGLRRGYCIEKKWTEEEERLLLENHVYYSHDWQMLIEQYFPNRTERSVRGKYHELITKRDNKITKH